MVTDADKWDGMLAGLSAPGSMTGGVTKEGLLGAIQASDTWCGWGRWFGAVGYDIRRKQGGFHSSQPRICRREAVDRRQCFDGRTRITPPINGFHR